MGTAGPATPSGAMAARLGELLAGVGVDQPELVDPPPGLWDRIAAAVAREAALPHAGAGADGSPSGAGDVVEYRIDADDRLVTYGDGWDRFAAGNEAPELVAPAGRPPLWDAIGDDGLADLWRSVVTRARRSGRPVVAGFRCDGPRARRWFELTVTPEPDGHVHFHSRLTFEMERPEVAALCRDAAADRDLPTVDVCCWCAEASVGDGWAAVEEVLARHRLLERVPPPPVAFAVCPRCRRDTALDLLGSASSAT